MQQLQEDAWERSCPPPGVAALGSDSTARVDGRGRTQSPPNLHVRGGACRGEEKAVIFALLTPVSSAPQLWGRKVE